MKNQLRQGDVLLVRVDSAKGKEVSKIVARGEHSNHSHVITGDAVVTEDEGQLFVSVGNEGALLQHILETEYLKGNEVWTGEHHKIDLKPGKYKVVHQVEYDPYEKAIKRVDD